MSGTVSWGDVGTAGCLGPAEVACHIHRGTCCAGASVVIPSFVAGGFGIPVSGLALILGVDRLPDMARTAVNEAGDLVACRILGSLGLAGEDGHTSSTTGTGGPA